MKTDKERLKKIYEKTRGKCHLCHKKLALKNYGIMKSKGAWEIEHSKPQSKGGTDHLNNLYPACIVCNRQKSNGTNYSIRSKKGVQKAPLSHKAKKSATTKNTIKGAVVGAAVGRILGPFGALVGGAIGAIIGNEKETDK